MLEISVYIHFVRNPFGSLSIARALLCSQPRLYHLLPYSVGIDAAGSSSILFYSNRTPCWLHSLSVQWPWKVSVKSISVPLPTSPTPTTSILYESVRLIGRTRRAAGGCDINQMPLGTEERRPSQKIRIFTNSNGILPPLSARTSYDPC